MISGGKNNKRGSNTQSPQCKFICLLIIFILLFLSFENSNNSRESPKKIDGNLEASQPVDSFCK